MEVLFDRVGGLDVHRDQVTACVRVPRPSGRGRSSTVSEFSTTAGGLAALAGWLAEAGVTHVGMEATGIYWRPVLFALEGQFELMLVTPTRPSRVAVRGVLRSVASQVWARLLDDGIYPCSISTMYRLLRIAGENRERRRQHTHPARKKPELIARAPNEVWSWDITKLAGPERGVYYELFVIIDIYSRYVAAWTVPEAETGELAEAFIKAALDRQQIGRNQLTLHADGARQ